MQKKVRDYYFKTSMSKAKSRSRLFHDMADVNFNSEHSLRGNKVTFAILGFTLCEGIKKIPYFTKFIFEKTEKGQKICRDGRSTVFVFFFL